MEVWQHGSEPEKGGVPTPGQEELLPQVEEFKYFSVLFTGERMKEWEIDRWIRLALAVMQMLWWSEHESKAVSLAVDLRSNPHLWPWVTVVTDRMRSKASFEGWLSSPLHLIFTAVNLK